VPTVRTEVRFWEAILERCREHGRVGGKGIVGYEVEIRGRLNIYMVPGVSVAGDGYTGRIGILTVISGNAGPRRTEWGDNDSAAIPRRNARKPWFCIREQTTRCIDARGHWEMLGAIDGLKEFYSGEGRVIIGVGLRA